MIADHIIFDSKNGEVHWCYDVQGGFFATLNLPWFFENAPQDVKVKLVEWCRRRALDTESTEPLPYPVKEYRDSYEVKKARGIITERQFSLEDYQ